MENLPGFLIKFFSSYLSERCSKIKCNDSISDSFSVTNGAPQRSVLGPTLFNYYISDFPQGDRSIGKILYADDVILFKQSKLIGNSVRIMKSYISNISQYLVNKNLNLNVNKCEAIIISETDRFIAKKDRQFVRNGQVIVNNSMIPFWYNLKYRGVFFHKSCSTVYHINNLVPKARFFLN